MRKLLKITGYALLALLGLIVLLAVFAVLPPGEAIIEGILEDQLASVAGYPVSIEDFDWNLFSHLSLAGLVIGDPESKQPSVRLSHLSVGYNLHRFLFKDIDLDDILIDSIDVSLLRDSSGTLLLPVRATGDGNGGTAESDTSSSGFAITFDSLAVNHIGFSYTDYALNVEANVVHSEINVGRDSADTYRYSFSIDSTQSQYSGTELPAVSMTTRGQAGPNRVRVDTLTARTDSLELAASAAMSLDKDTTVRGKVVLRGDPSPMLDRARRIYELPDFTTKGDLNASVDIEGRPSSPRVRSDIDAPAIDVANVSAGESRIMIAYSNDTLRIDSV